MRTLEEIAEDLVTHHVGWLPLDELKWQAVLAALKEARQGGDDEPAAGVAGKPCVNASNTHYCMLCGLAIPGAAEHAGIELKALDRFERLAVVLREARLTDEQRAEVGGLLNAIRQSYRKLAEDRDGWRNAMAAKATETAPRARAANGKIVGFEHDGRAVILYVQIPPPSFPVSASDAVRLTWRAAEADKEEPR